MPNIHDFKLGDLVRVAAYKYIIYPNHLCESNNHGKVIDINPATGSLCIEFLKILVVIVVVAKENLDIVIGLTQVVCFLICQKIFLLSQFVQMYI